jgi:hypothetical protein
MIVDLIEAGIEKSLKLNFCNRMKSIDSHAKSYANNPCLSEGRIDYPISPKFCLESIGDAKDATFLSNILTQDHHKAIPFHLFPKS